MLAARLNASCLSVSQINNLAKNTLEANYANVAVVGEISKFINHSSGHWYFTIKDELASLDCTMFASHNKNKRALEPGNKVILLGRLSIYPASGKYQLNCVNYELADTQGRMQAAFNELYERLNKEGLFNQKKPLPKKINNIAIITAINSAAAQDILRVYENNEAFLTKLVFYDSLMQGENASKMVISRLMQAQNNAHDIILIARGGGSKEDLFCFNDEALVRAIAASRVPVVTGLGHEIDTHLSDLAASKYYPTPSAAMQALVYNKGERLQELDILHDKLKRASKAALAKKEQDYLYLSSKFSPKEISFKFKSYQNELAAKSRLLNKVKNTLKYHENALQNKSSLIQQSLANSLFKKRQMYNSYKQIISANKLSKRLQSSKNWLEFYKNELHKKSLQNIKFKSQKINNFAKLGELIDIKLQNANKQLVNKKSLLIKTFKPKFKEKYATINTYQQILSTHQAFLESVKEYARLMKNDKPTSLKTLQIGDEVVLKALDCEKVAKIIKEIK